MKHCFTTALAAACILVQAPAATIVGNYNEGKDKAGDDGFVVVVYPDGWNAKNEKLAKAIINSPEFSKAAGNAMILGVPYPNASTKEMNDKRNKEVLGALKIPMGVGVTLSFPAIYMCEKDGRNYSIINAQEFRLPAKAKGDFTKTAITRASKEVAARLSTIKKQRALMAKAANASGKDKIDLIAKACNMPGISNPDKVADIVAKADPKDEYGLGMVLKHNTYGYIEGSAAPKDWKERLADIDAKLKNPYYSPVVKQTLYTSAIGLLRRNGGSAERERMMSYLRLMRKLDPDSVYGKSYEGAMRLWDSWSTEWKPEMIPASNGPMEVKTPSMKDPGVYTVSFNFSRGKHALLASAVELWDGSTKISEDVHECFAGNRHNGHVYTLEVPKKLSDPKIIIMTKMGNNRDSSGTINIMQQ